MTFGIVACLTCHFRVPGLENSKRFLSMKCNIACFLLKHCSADHVIRVIILFSGIRLWLSVGKRNLRKGQHSSGFVLRLKNSFMTERFVRNISSCLVLFFISKLLSLIFVQISVIILLKKKGTLSLESMFYWIQNSVGSKIREITWFAC